MSRHWSSTYKLSVEPSELLLERLLDTIVMNQNFSTLRTPDSLEALAEVRDMDTLAVRSQRQLSTRMMKV